MAAYADTIREFNKTHDPDLIEGFMRLQYRTLDHLDRATFRKEVRIAAACIDQVGVAEARRLLMVNP